jgi:hypothetical protein
MIAFHRAALAAKVGILLGALALAGCAGDEDPIDPGSPSSTSGGDGGSADGGAGGQGGAGGAGQGGGGGDLGPCNDDCSVYGPPGDPCYVGVCNTGEYPGTVFACVVVPAPKGTACEDGLFCTAEDTCDKGVCTAGPPNTCDLTLEPCTTIVCDETSQACSQAPAEEESACVLDGSDLCEVNGKCTAGECVGVPKDCTFSPLTECNVVACNPANGLCEGTPDAGKEGAACALNGDLCQVGKTCQGGACLGGTPKDCSDLSVGCNNGVCNPNSGFCEAEPVPAGGACAEGNDECNTGVCDANSTCVPTPKPNGTSCNDFSTCTENDSCTAGVCDGAAVAGCLFYLQSSFEACPENWTLVPDWECGTPTKAGAPQPHSGTGVLATLLAANYSSGWEWNEFIVAESPAINLTDATDPVLSFFAWISTEGGTWDGVNLKISTDNGVTWSLVSNVDPPYNLPTVGISPNQEPAWGDDENVSWKRYTADLSSYAGQVVKLRFHFRTDGGGVRPGVFIDDLAVAEAAAIPLVVESTSPYGDAVPGEPFSVQMQFSGGTANATWGIVGGTNNGWMTFDPVTGVLSGTPTVADLGLVEVVIRAEEPSLPSNFDEETVSFYVRDVAQLESFDAACPAGWTLAGEFECGVPTLVGPATAHSGAQCLGTNLDGNYSNGIAWGTTTATSPAISVPAGTGASMRFWAWVDTEGSTYDGFNMKVSVNGGSYVLVTDVLPAYTLTVNNEPAWGGHLSAQGWTMYELDLSPHAGSSVQVRFDFRTDGSGVNPGVYIDDVTVLE